MSALLDPATQVEVALKQLDVAYERARLNWSSKDRLRLAWIPLVYRIVTRAATHRWSELAHGRASEVEIWRNDLDKMQNLDKIPDWCDILQTSIGRLLERSFAFYRFYLERIAQEDNASPFISDKHSKATRRKLPSWLSDHKSPCYRITEQQWESELVTNERRNVFVLLDTDNDPSELLQQIVQKVANAKTNSLGHRAPMGTRQTSIYYGRL